MGAWLSEGRKGVIFENWEIGKNLKKRTKEKNIRAGLWFFKLIQQH